MAAVPLKWVVVGLGAGVTVLGFLGMAYVAEKQQKHKDREKRRVLNLVQHRFGSHRADVVKYLAKQSWNNFDVDKLNRIYDHFLKYLEGPAHGVLGRREFTEIHRKLAVKDDKVIESLFRFWDLNADGNVDFVELVEGLNLFCFGSRTHKLERLFRVFDLDDNGFITRAELKQLLTAFLDKHDEKRVEEAVRKLFSAADSNNDSRLSYKEFLSLASHKDFELAGQHGFMLRFIQLFGLDASLAAAE